MRLGMGSFMSRKTFRLIIGFTIAGEKISKGDYS
jgi:hypothetical protein